MGADYVTFNKLYPAWFVSLSAAHIFQKSTVLTYDLKTHLDSKNVQLLSEIENGDVQLTGVSRHPI